MNEIIINYSKEFLDKTKEVFPNWLSLHAKIKKNESIEDSLKRISTNFSPYRICRYFKEGQLIALQKAAKRQIAITELSGMWYNEKEKMEKELKLTK